MGNKIYRLFEYAYLVMFLLAAYAVYANWAVDRNKAYLFLGFAVLAVFMFFFKRRFRKSVEERNRNDQK